MNELAKLDTKIFLTDEYYHFSDELRNIWTERIFNSLQEGIMAHAEVGHAIYHNPLYKQYQVHDDFLTQVAADAGISLSEIYRSIQFYEKFCLKTSTPEKLDIPWNEFSEGKKLSWTTIKNHYLPEAKEKQITESSQPLVNLANACIDIIKSLDQAPELKSFSDDHQSKIASMLLKVQGKINLYLQEEK